MKQLFIIASAVTLFGCNPAMAETITDHYKSVIVQKPYTVEVCTQGTTSNKSDVQNFLEGAIVGGAIGNNIPGENNGGALGAFLGGVYNTERNKNKGPQCRTETRYEEERREVYSHSTIVFTYEGRQHSVNFKK